MCDSRFGEIRAFGSLYLLYLAFMPIALADAVEAFMRDLAGKARGFTSGALSVCELPEWDEKLGDMEWALRHASLAQVRPLFDPVAEFRSPSLRGRGLGVSARKAFALSLFLVLARRARDAGTRGVWFTLRGSSPPILPPDSLDFLFTDQPWPRPFLEDTLADALGEQGLRCTHPDGKSHHYVATAALQVGVHAVVAERELVRLVRSPSTGRRLFNDLQQDARLGDITRLLRKKVRSPSDNDALASALEAFPWFASPVSLETIVNELATGKLEAAAEALVEFRVDLDMARREFPLRVVVVLASPDCFDCSRIVVRWDDSDIARAVAYEGAWVVTSGSLTHNFLDPPVDVSFHVSVHDRDANLDEVAERELNLVLPDELESCVVARDDGARVELRVDLEDHEGALDGAVQRWTSAVGEWGLMPMQNARKASAPRRFVLDRLDTRQDLAGRFVVDIRDEGPAPVPNLRVGLARNLLDSRATGVRRWRCEGRLTQAPLSAPISLSLTAAGRTEGLKLTGIFWRGIAAYRAVGWVVCPTSWHTIRTMRSGRVLIWAGAPFDGDRLCFGSHESVATRRRVRGGPFALRVDALATAFGRALTLSSAGGDERFVIPFDDLEGMGAPADTAEGSWFTLMPGAKALASGRHGGVRVLVHEGVIVDYDLRHLPPHGKYDSEAYLGLARAGRLPIAAGRYRKDVQAALVNVVRAGGWPGRFVPPGLRVDVYSKTWSAVLRELLDREDVEHVEQSVLHAAEHGEGMATFESVRDWFSVDAFIASSLLCRLFRDTEEPAAVFEALRGDPFLSRCYELAEMDDWVDTGLPDQDTFDRYRRLLRTHAPGDSRGSSSVAIEFRRVLGLHDDPRRRAAVAAVLARTLRQQRRKNSP